MLSKEKIKMKQPIHFGTFGKVIKHEVKFRMGF